MACLAGTTAQDLLQDVFFKALRQGGRFCNVTNTSAWLFEVARNTLSDHLRRARLRLKAKMTDACRIQTSPQGGVDAFIPRCD